MSLPWRGPCVGCGRDEELRGGWCFDCATMGERKAANMTVWQHLAMAFANARQRRFDYATFDLRWAWQRLTRTGDYRRGGYFEREGHFR